MVADANQTHTPTGDREKTDWRCNRLVTIIETSDNQLRNQSLDELCKDSDIEELLRDITALGQLWRNTDNLYAQVRALFFLSAIHRYHLPKQFDRSHQRRGKSRLIVTDNCWAGGLSSQSIPY
ncbi:MAG: hypothetical protein ACKVHR_13615 [Pirellulales bacterium]|jgi:hypothetical protein